MCISTYSYKKVIDSIRTTLKTFGEKANKNQIKRNKTVSAIKSLLPCVHE